MAYLTTLRSAVALADDSTRQQKTRAAISSSFSRTMSRAAGAPSVSSLSSLCLSPNATVLDAAIRDFRDSRRHRLLLDRIRRPEPALVEGEQRCLFDIESVNNNLVDNNLRFREVSYLISRPRRCDLRFLRQPPPPSRSPPRSNPPSRVSSRRRRTALSP